ncbi:MULTISPECIES: sigma-54-dependent transcriptional regulator [Methylobacteriaceae]|jgi:two-component system nitrogen regulation response regulator NtrX|uniref:Two-component sigma-54 specific nitrogen transcriptional regulator, Fis subfamily N-terminal response receiver n=5 Tax=Methylorubrum extorquens TaxID=408 RepID=C5AVT6_METEA|nr:MULTISPECIES: sigma-54 dependent transcriptional regulator [Methylobacteriaceae]KQO95241.1 AAA family ATPase [Methylobacterium sp. Leaf92]KQP87915.1 AAA family ATPase [Methylobacterium sp. Leaf119]KQP98828.1 AAA family ATPase [Methylobacterium sp. Leaf121]MBA9066915.1 two-component system nitrogen regulation response regulator NtrX [Methylobacterium sp. RAS18]MDF9864950.1 two-component system nitrogen regulation response regulator NtrX [Methylorubrum pseudosasae]MDH6638524.1 two-component 
MSADILIVDDEADIRDLVAGILDDEGHRTRTAAGSDEALAAIESRRPHLVFLDIWLQGSRLDGLQVLDLIKAGHPDLPVVMISGHGNIETAVAAIKSGAYDFIEKPFKADRLILVAERALEASRLKREVRDLKVRSGQASRIVGGSVAVNQLRQTIERVAPTNARVMISGAPGAGKELSARTLHAASSRASGPFVVINAATITPETMEAELFGVEGGEGRVRRVGALEEAHGGSLYIDEVADMPKETQSRILRVLVDQNFQRVGGTARVHVDVRIISSSSRDLTEEIAAGRFREDLFHRLSVVPIRIPSLAERREDVPELITFFMEQISAATGLPRRRIAEDAMAVLQSHDWPGNVRQLRNNVERLMILTQSDPDQDVTSEMLPTEIGALVPTTPTGAGGEKLMSLALREAREIFEREYLIAQIARFSGNISRTAEFIGMERSALHRKLKSLGIGP